MPTETFEVIVTTAAPRQRVFDLLVDIQGWRAWAGPLARRTTRERDGKGDPNGVGAIRRMGMAPVVSREEIVELVPPSRMSYIIVSGVPVRRYRSTVTLSEDAGTTTIRWGSTFEPRVPGTGSVLRMGLRAAVSDLARRVAAEAARTAPRVG